MSLKSAIIRESNLKTLHVITSIERGIENNKTTKKWIKMGKFTNFIAVWKTVLKRSSKGF